jgi:Protein of unknown function (DUF4058)
MPLRDHFRLPTTRYGSWESLHGMWPAIIIQELRRQLPPGFVSSPRVRLGPYFEIDIAAFENDDASPEIGSFPDNGGATATLAPTRPTWAIDTDVPEEDEFEVRIYNVEEERRLVAAIEIVSPANKDRPEKRRAFVGKCGALLRKGVAVSIVDLVTIRHANLYAELMAFIGHPDPNLGPEPPPMSASSCRWASNAEGTRARLSGWSHPMAVGQPLPPLPLWLSDTQSVALDLERTYETTCRDLSIP